MQSAEIARRGIDGGPRSSKDVRESRKTVRAARRIAPPLLRKWNAPQLLRDGVGACSVAIRNQSTLVLRMKPHCVLGRWKSEHEVACIVLFFLQASCFA